MDRRTIGCAILIIALGVAGAGGGYVMAAALEESDAASGSDSAEISTESSTLRHAAMPGPLLVRAVNPEVPRADGSLFELSPDGSAKRVSELDCKRVHRVAAGTGLCLTLADNRIDYDGVIFGPRYRELTRFPVDGVPDRARVSPDGLLAAYTSFDRAGSEGYFTSPSDFSTFTRIVDAETGDELLRLEDLDVTRRGRPVDISDADLWGVTFAGGQRFYATLATDDGHHLISGTVDGGRARIVAERVECPALSPDGGRIAYKRRIGDSNRWRFHVLDLASGDGVALAEDRSIDDQPEWLDDDRIVYSDDQDLFVVSADGTGAPQRLASGATSPASLASRR